MSELAADGVCDGDGVLLDVGVDGIDRVGVLVLDGKGAAGGVGWTMAVEGGVLGMVSLGAILVLESNMNGVCQRKTRESVS